MLTLRTAILHHLAENPGELDAGDLARLVLPFPPAATPPTCLDDVYARRAARMAHEAQAAAKVSRALKNLTAAGLVAPVGAPVLSPWFAREVEARGVALALERAHPRWPGRVPVLALHRSLVVEVGTKGPESVCALLGERPDGARKRAYRDLGEWGCIVRPTARTLTAAGLDRVGRAA